LNDFDDDSGAIIAPEHAGKVVTRAAEEQAIIAEENLDVVLPSFAADEDPPTERELDAERAFKAQVFAFLFFPIHLIALTYIIQVAASPQRLEGRPRRQFGYAVALHAFAWLFFTLIARMLFAAR
jgi:hypothetical protein